MLKSTKQLDAGKPSNVKDDLPAGRPASEGITAADLCNVFLAFKGPLIDRGELAGRTFARCEATAKFLASSLSP